MGGLDRKLPVREGIMSDRVFEKEFSLDGVTKITLDTQNCRIKLKSTEKSVLSYYVSSNRDYTTISSEKENNEIKIKVLNTQDTGNPPCFLDIIVPKDTTIPSLKIIIKGEDKPDMVVLDEGEPLTITNLEFKLDKASPLIFLN